MVNKLGLKDEDLQKHSPLRDTCSAPQRLVSSVKSESSIHSISCSPVCCWRSNFSHSSSVVSTQSTAATYYIQETCVLCRLHTTYRRHVFYVGYILHTGDMDVVIVESTDANITLERLNSLWLRKELCDVTLCCGGREFTCHRVVLATFSYFEAMFTSEMVESTQDRIQINDVDPEALGLLLSYAYTSTVSITQGNVQALLAASNLFNVTAVLETCCRYIEFHMDELNCVEIHCFADALGCATLEQHSMDYILEHFSDVYQQDEFLSLSVDKLTEIVSSDHLNVPQEEMVFEAVMLWLNKCPTRRDGFEKVLVHVRLPHVSPVFLRVVMECVDVVRDSQACQRLITEAKKQHLLPYSQRAQPRKTAVILIVRREVDDIAGDGNPVECFDPLTKQWKSLASLPINNVCQPSLAVSGSYVYLAGGYYSDHCDDPHHSKEMWRYDTRHDSWVKMASMNEAHDLVTSGGYMFAMKGRGECETAVNSIERYNPITNTWQIIECVGMPDDSGPLSVAVLDGLMYAMTDDNKTYKSNHEASVWTQVAPAQVDRYAATACSLNGKIYLLGGDSMDIMNPVESFNPRTNQWTLCAPMNKERFRPDVAVLHGKIYALGGESSDIEQYDVERDTWEMVGEMPTGCETLQSCVSVRLRKDAHAK